MSNILIIAQGPIAKAFISKVTEKDTLGHHYTVLTNDELNLEKRHNLDFVSFDPTSLFRLKNFYQQHQFKSVFIIYYNMDEAKAIYENIRSFNQKIRIVILDSNGHFRDMESDGYTNIIDATNILINRLYDYLPNVPVIAQNIGLHQGEIMEVMVPFSSTYAFRHISSIPQIKWKIAAIYRDNKLLLPNSATMIRPRDMLLIIGKPQILQNVYKRIRNENGLFPEPFGKNFYLYLDIDNDGPRALEYIEEAIYFLNKFDNKTLIIRVTHPNDLEVVNKIKEYEREQIFIYFSFDEIDESVVGDDILTHEVGLILLSFESLKKSSCSKRLHAYKKLIYLFGETKLPHIREAVVVYNHKKSIEEISSVAFYISEILKIKLSLRDYDPQGKFNGSSFAIEHFETLSHVHNTKVEIIQKRKNPIKAIKKAQNILLVIPFSSRIDLQSFKVFFQRDIDSLLLRTNSHPKLLIPIEET